MSASDSLGPQWEIRTDGSRQVRAYHPKTGKHVGSLNWTRPDPQVKEGPNPPRVYKAVVHEDFRRQGVGRALFNGARNLEPELHHSLPHALSADGAAFAAGTPVSDPIQPVEIKPARGKARW